ncbi:putative cytochrome P450 6a21 [Lycorma delicatula]|uniref:putative cytochrome P450 6a21 n=1 Tax=Lycorma delicatula TaxID=130591 RepID=UPI003F512378
MEISWLITAVLAIIIVFFMYWMKERNINYLKKQGIRTILDGDITLKFILDLFIFRTPMSDFFGDIYKNLKGEKFGGYFQFFTPTIIVKDPEIINQVLIKDFTHFEDRGPPQEKMLDLFSLSIGTLCGDEWRAARHKLTPTFTSGKLKMMFEPIKECCNEGVLFLKDKIGQDVDARSLMGKFIVKIIANVSFGISIDTFNEKEAMQNEFVKATSNFFKPSIGLLLKFMALNSCPKIRKIIKFKLVDDDINNFFQKITKDIIKVREESNTRRNDFLQIMLDEKKREQGLLKNDNKPTSCNEYEKEDQELLDQLKNTPTSSSNWSTSEMFTEEFIAAQTFLFISGGSETTAATMSFVLFELAMNQDIQKQAKKEIKSILSSQEFNYQAVKKMVYLEQIIYETLRLHTVAPMLGRYCTKDYKMPGTNVIIEKGSMVMIPAGCLQKDPQYFPDPLKFNPDRFEDMEAIPKGVFFPFGSGPRICIAMRLAMLKMKIIVATLLLNYTITLSEKTKLPLKMMKNSVFNHVEGGMWIKFEKDND